MSDIRKWMERWEEEHVTFDGFPSEEIPDPAAEQLVKYCLIDAEEDGIGQAELEEEFGDLPTYFHQALHRKAYAELNRQASKKY